MPEPRAGGAAGTRLILYVGKGGVGKTTLAAATAARVAELGRRTLVVSTDIAHSLGDVLAAELGAAPREVAPRLFAQEINVLEETRRGFARVQEQMAEFLRREGISSVQAEELAIVPGMQEVAALVQIGRRIRGGEFDCLVVDAAPTGETLRLLSMPESFGWYARRLNEWRGRLTRLVKPLMRKALPDLDLIDTMDQIAARVRELRAVLTDARRSSYRIVATPDMTVLKEAQRAETYLNLFDYPIDAVVLNRVMPLLPVAAAAEGDGYLAALAARQGRAVAAVRAAFAGLPLFEAPLSAEEPIGVAALQALAQQIFGEQDPAAVLHTGPTRTIAQTAEGYTLRIPMPNVEAGKLSLSKRGDELYVDVGNFRREIPLPVALAMLEPGVARLRQGLLEIPFARQKAG